MIRTLLSFLFAICCMDVCAQDSDVLLQTLKDELNSEYQQLRQQPVKPYFMSLRVNDFRRVTIQSNMGVAATEDIQEGRTLTPQIRVGNPRLDNFKLITQGAANTQGRDIAPWVLPMNDNDVEGIRAGIWSEVRRRYDFAVNVYRETQAKVSTNVADEDTAACFSVAPVEQYYEQPLTAEQKKIDIEAWRNRMNKVSAVMAAYPELQGGTAQLNFEVSRQYIVNTEGTYVVQNRIAARVMITAQGMASDGMVLPVSFDYYATSLDKLPDVDVMIVKAKELVQRVKALMKAPVANPYTGPAILSGPASGVFFHEIFGHRLEAHRLKSGGETFRNMVGKNVLPSDFSVYCDPTLSYYRDKELNGHYLFDSEGVRSRRVDNIKNGVLNEFLLSRVPMDGFPQSNGHGRASDGHDAVSRQSSLIVETTAPQTEEKLREMLRAEAKKQGKEYGYYFLTVTGGFTTTGQGNTMNSFNVSPVEVYRVYVDGRPDELVRGVDLIGTPLSMFSHIAAAGNEPTLFTGSCGAESGWVPVACVSPQIYVTQIETQRRKKAQQTPQILAAPDNSLSPTSDLKEVMKKEVSRAADELNIRGAMQPLLVSSIANTSRTARIVGELGGISMNYISPWTTTIGSEVTIGDIKQSSKVEADRYFSQVACVGEKVDANAVRRAVWNTADNSYKDALNVYAQKQNYYTQHPLPLEYANTNDLILPAATSAQERITTDIQDIDMKQLGSLVVELSSVFKNYPHLYDTSVSFDVAQMNTLRITNTGLEVNDSQQVLTMTVDATTQNEDGTPWNDKMVLSYPLPDFLKNKGSLVERINTFASNLMALRDAPVLDEEYNGPVMFEEMASVYSLTDPVITAVCASHALQPADDDYGKKIGQEIIDKRISAVNYSDRRDYNGVPLMGAYSVDADGIVPEKELLLVENGVLRQQLNNLRPTPFAKNSTGSCRFPVNPGVPSPEISFGSLHIKAVNTTADEKMEKTLLKTAKKAGLKNAYIVSLPEGCSLMRLYRIDTKTGQRTLMRTDNMVESKQAQLKALVAVSAKEKVVNMANSTQNSVIAPRAFIVAESKIAKPVLRAAPIPAVTYPLNR
ncbi:MAG: hypothetical protein ILA07_00340 [Prevotella sp.]|nr:hypothetical protein [Prevotella sp.]